MSSWLDLCEAFARGQGLDEDRARALLAVLAAFRSPDPRGGPPPPPEPTFAGDFAALERSLAAALDLDAVAVALVTEVDADQARLFARRLLAVDQALASDTPVERLLRVGLRMRAQGIVESEGSRALRLRALADFYYSQYGRERHRAASSPAPRLAERLTTLRWRPLASGLDYARIVGDCAEGPVSINLLRAEPERIHCEARDCREALARGLSFAEIVSEAGALAAVSGGFFLYSEPDIAAPSERFDPVGLLLERGRPLRHPPVFRRGSVLVGIDGAIEIARLGLEGVQMQIGPDLIEASGAITRVGSREGPAQASVAIVGDRVVACGQRLAVPLNGFVVPLARGRELPVGARVRYAPLKSPSARALASGIAGGPMLVVDGRSVLDMRSEDFWGSAPPVTFSQDETGDRNLLPRLAAGVDERGRLMLAAVDGRNVERALGMTLAELAELMIGLGCVRATNLDGGSSKRMVVEGRSVDLATTEVVVGEGGGDQRIRPVRTGLLLFAS